MHYTNGGYSDLPETKESLSARSNFFYYKEYSGLESLVKFSSLKQNFTLFAGLGEGESRYYEF